MQNFLNGFYLWFNSRKTKTFLVLTLTALLGYLNHTVSAEQALNAILVGAVTTIVGTAVEDAAAKLNKPVEGP